MRELGLNPSGDMDPDVDTKAAVMAPAERLTGVRVTAQLPAEAEYRLGVVPEEPVQEPWRIRATAGTAVASVTIDIWNAQGEQAAGADAPSRLRTE